MSILEKLNKAIMEKDGAAAGELVHDDYKMFSHLKGEYVHMGKAGMVEAVSKGMMSPQNTGSFLKMMKLVLIIHMLLIKMEILKLLCVVGNLKMVKSLK